MLWAGLVPVWEANAAQQTPANPAPTVQGPSAPVPPAVFVRDSSGRTTLRAVRVESGIQIDGRLEEPVYATSPAMTDFIQNDPQEGAPATQKTEMWIFFDQNNVYVTARCWEDHPERMVANEMRRDSFNIVQSENFGFAFDTFNDRRTSVIFELNAVGGRIDAQVINDTQVNMDWNPVWDFKVGKFEGGWVIETAIPFKSLRYGPGRAQVWGFNARRVNRWKNEASYLAPVPAELTLRGHFQGSRMATLFGIEAPPGSRNLEIKPYGIANLTSDRLAVPAISNDVAGDAGIDLKYGVTQNLTADFTYNTDFAQVEADEQQVNLTRFNLFFPEKREFFLENQGTFAFGGAAAGPITGPVDTPVLFYSRQIGFNEGRAIPIVAGGRLTGRVGRYSVGLLDIQAGNESVSGTRATNFSVVRLKRDILRRSSIGVLATGRSLGPRGTGTNEAFGVDGSFAFHTNLSINTYWAETRTSALTGDDRSYRAQLDYSGDRYGVAAERLVVGANFNPATGFVRRADMRKSYGLFRFSPRPSSIPSIRRFSATGSWTYIENGSGRLETRATDGEFAIEFQNSDRLSVGATSFYEYLPASFPIASNVSLPVGGYDFASVRAGYDLGQQHRVSGSFLLESGTFYDGRKTTLSLSRGRVNFSARLAVEPTLSLNWVDLDEGSFTNRLVGSRITYTLSPLTFVSALVQYNSATRTVAANVRLRWEYRPGSELFVVFNEQRDTLSRGFPRLDNRAFIVKVNRLFRV
jgi:hypothetical protein